MYVCFSPKCPKKPVFYGNASKLTATARKPDAQAPDFFNEIHPIGWLNCLRAVKSVSTAGGWISFHFAVKPQNFTSAKPLFHFLPSGKIFHFLSFLLFSMEVNPWLILITKNKLLIFGKRYSIIVSGSRSKEC